MFEPSSRPNDRYNNYYHYHYSHHHNLTIGINYRLSCITLLLYQSCHPHHYTPSLLTSLPSSLPSSALSYLISFSSLASSQTERKESTGDLLFCAFEELRELKGMRAVIFRKERDRCALGAAYDSHQEITMRTRMMMKAIMKVTTRSRINPWSGDDGADGVNLILFLLIKIVICHHRHRKHNWILWHWFKLFNDKDD